MPMNRRPGYPRVRGATLVELVISIVIIGVGAVGVLSVIATQGRYSADPMIQQQAVAIAEAYLEEILPKSFAEPGDAQVCAASGPEAGEATRTSFDDVDDYHGLVNNGCSNPGGGACDQFGGTIAGLESYRIDVVVACEAFETVADTHSKRVEVSVSHPAGVSISVASMRLSMEP